MSLERRTLRYGMSEGVPLHADVICAGSAPDRRPCVMWIHGGGLIFGSRTISPRPYFTGALVEHGFVVVSIDHRLAPETKLPAIVDDVAAAWRWIHEAGPDLFGVDPARVCVAGASAGAYLSLTMGHLGTPRPRAVASLWGFGDITAPWEAEPSAHYRQAPLVERADALASLALTPVPTADGNDRSRFYLHCRQQGVWLPEVTGHAWPQEAAWFEPWCPLRRIDAAFPPTVLVHGHDDTDVPASESDALAERMRALGVPHAYHALPGVGHGFAGATTDQAQAIETAVAEFLQVHAAA
ncbi:MAG: alpha/beta hydrolase [Rubrivivax sp.]|nr:alpha/beta hydrolase [Rubrivivax sp.]